jgi:hypothetical protein
LYNSKKKRLIDDIATKMANSVEAEEKEIKRGSESKD